MTAVAAAPPGTAAVAVTRTPVAAMAASAAGTSLVPGQARAASSGAPWSSAHSATFCSK